MTDISKVDFDKLRDDLLELLDPEVLTWSIDLSVLYALAFQCLSKQLKIENDNKDKTVGECLNVLKDMGFIKYRMENDMPYWYIS